MSFKANVYNVMIASPSDVTKERAKVVEALAEWNRQNTAERKCVFLPLRWEEDSAARMGCPPQETLNRQLCERSDMLIAIFWTRLGTPTEGHLDKLLHGRNAGFKKIYMIPKKLGKAEMKVTYQCRQFPDEIMGKVKVEVLAEDAG